MTKQTAKFKASPTTPEVEIIINHAAEDWIRYGRLSGKTDAKSKQEKAKMNSGFLMSVTNNNVPRR